MTFNVSGTNLIIGFKFENSNFIFVYAATGLFARPDTRRTNHELRHQGNFPAAKLKFHKIGGGRIWMDIMKEMM